MLKKLIALSVVFGLVVSDPVAKLTAPSYDDISYEPSYVTVRNERSDLQIPPNVISLVMDLITSVVGYKATAVTLAVAAIKWLVSNGIMLAIGAFLTLGFCKVTGKCQIVEHIVPVDLHSFLTPERLESAEKIFVKAVKRYAQEKRSQ